LWGKRNGGRRRGVQEKQTLRRGPGKKNIDKKRVSEKDIPEKKKKKKNGHETFNRGVSRTEKTLGGHWAKSARGRTYWGKISKTILFFLGKLKKGFPVRENLNQKVWEKSGTWV